VNLAWRPWLYLPSTPVERGNSGPLSIARSIGETIPLSRMIACAPGFGCRLKELGYAVIEVVGPAALLCSIVKNRSTCLFTDIVMPGGMTGATSA
jgi:hypothetical protein